MKEIRIISNKDYKILRKTCQNYLYLDGGHLQPKEWKKRSMDTFFLFKSHMKSSLDKSKTIPHGTYE